MNLNNHHSCNHLNFNELEYNHHCCNHLKINKKKKVIDPSKTLTLRRAFERDMIRRFDELDNEIYKLIVKDDAFGLDISNRELKFHSPSRQYAFRRSDEKVLLFKKWLKEMSKKGILEYTKSGKISDGQSFWADIYISSAYKKGIQRGIAEIKKGIKDISDPKLKKKYYESFKQKIPFSDDINASINAMFFSPTHSDSVALIYTRVFTDLEGITEQMSSKMSSILAQFLVEGKSPRDAARELSRQLEIFKNRARTIARTEMIRAHHEANINVYEQAGIEEVKIQAEWVATKDDRVCLKCSSLDGRIFSLEEIRPMIPVHPNCRCAAVPVINETMKNKRS